MKKIITLLLAATLFAFGTVEVYAGALSPYEKLSKPEEFVNGATFVLKETGEYKEWLATELQRARDIYHINTITVYGLEQFDDAYKTCLFKELNRLNMKICIRIESYGEGFAFTKEDAADVMKRYKELIEFTCLPENRDMVFYYAINMPVDDGKVQENLGGVNSETSKVNQVSYAQQIVSSMRKLTAENGFENAKLFLSVFFGWDDTYEIPSYASAGADGYFINNYTYPIKGKLPDSSAKEEDIINVACLKRTMNKFFEVYPQQPPLMIETGFHTLEYNNGVMPSQTAGLVYDRATKEIAVKAMLDFYKSNYSNVIGVLYFGYNLFNQEGNPPQAMDWALSYPADVINEAEDAVLDKNAKGVKDKSASGEAAVLLEKDGLLLFQECPPTQQLVITYKAAKDTTLQLVSGNKVKKEIHLAANDKYQTKGIPLVVVEDYDLSIVCTEGEILVDKVSLFAQMEAEYADGESIHVKEMKGASQNYVVEKMVGKENALKFEGTRGGDKLLITYASKKDTKLALLQGSETYYVNLPASQELVSITANIEVAQNEDIYLYEEEDCGLVLDAIAFSGAPGAKNVDKKQEKTETNFTRKNLIAGCLIGIVIAAIPVGITLLYVSKRSRKHNEEN